MQPIEELKKHIDRLETEVIQLKKILIYQTVKDQKKADRAWRELMSASTEISALWTNGSAVEEVKYQREK